MADPVFDDPFFRSKSPEDPTVAPASVDPVFGDKFFSSPSGPMATPVEDTQPSGTLRRAADYGISALKGVIGLPQSIVGLADIPTGGYAGKVVKGFGVDFAGSQEFLSDLYSPEQKGAFSRVSEAAKEGVLPAIAQVAKDPSVIPHAIIESAPSMMGGWGLRNALIKAIPKVAPIAAAGFGEGAITAGSIAEQTRAKSESGLLTPEQTALSVGAGIATGVLGYLGGRLAKRLKIGDIDMLGSPAVGQEVKAGIFRRVIGGAISEGLLEELPQSLQEQAAQNVAQGKPWDEGLVEAGVMGAITGGVMGGGFNIVKPRTPVEKFQDKVFADPITNEIAKIEQELLSAESEAISVPGVEFEEESPGKATADAIAQQEAAKQVVPGQEVLPVQEEQPALEQAAPVADQVAQQQVIDQTTAQDVNAAEIPAQDVEVASDDAPVPPAIDETVNQDLPIDQSVTAETAPAPVALDEGVANAQREAFMRMPIAALQNYPDQRNQVLQEVLAKKQAEAKGTPPPATQTAAKVEVEANKAATSPVNELAEPTEAQKEAGNYKTGHTSIQGLDITIENPAGSIRKGKDEDGNPWETPVANHYGYIRGTESNKDGKLDVYVGPNPDSTDVFVVAQKNPKTGKFDENKTMVGFNSAVEARDAYLANYDKSGPDRVQSVTPMTMDQFKTWAKDGDVTKAPKMEGPGVTATRSKEAVKKAVIATHTSNITHIDDALKTGKIDTVLHKTLKYVSDTLRKHGLIHPIEIDHQATTDSTGLPLRQDANDPSTEAMLRERGISEADLVKMKGMKDGSQTYAQIVLEPDGRGGQRGTTIKIFPGADSRSVREELVHALQLAGVLDPGTARPGESFVAQYERHAAEILDRVDAGESMDDIVAKAVKPVPAAKPKKAKGSESLSLFSRSFGVDANDPEKVVRKINKDNPIESRKQIEDIARAVDQWRDVSENGWEQIESALKKAPTVGELAATGWAGRAARWWYADDEIFFKKHLKEDAYKFFGVMAATSPQSKAETENIRFGVNAWTDYTNLRKKLGREPDRAEIAALVKEMDVGMKVRRGGIIRALVGEQLGAQKDVLKTRFYHNALFGIEMGAVLDIWHGRGMGMMKFQKEKGKIAYGQDFGDSIIYSVLADRMDRAAETLNLPQSASQAGQWCVIKAIWDKMGRSAQTKKYSGLEALKDITNKDIALAGNYTTGIANYFRDNDPIIEKLVAIGIPRSAMAELKPAWEKLPERGIDPNARIYKDAHSAIKGELERLAARLEESRDIIDTLKAQEAQSKRDEPTLHVSLEVTHGPFAGLPWTKRLAMHNELRQGPLSDEVIRTIGITFGLKVAGVVDGTGTWYNPKTKQIEVNPNYSIQLSVPPGHIKERLADRIRGLGATFAYVGRQAAVGFTHPVALDPLFEAAGGPVMTINLGKVVSKEQAAALAKAIAENMPENSAFVVPTDIGAIISMPKFGDNYPLTYEEFAIAMVKVLDIAGINGVKEIRYSEKDILEGGDYYEGGRTGKEIAGDVSQYTDAIIKGGGPRALQRADKLLGKIDGVKESYTTGRIRKALADLDKERQERDAAVGQPAGLAEGAVRPQALASVGVSREAKKALLSPQDLLKVKVKLNKDPSIGATAEFKNKEAVLTHWSKVQNLKTTDPAMHGTGYAGAERRAKDSFPGLWIQKTYAGWGKYEKEDGLGKYRYEARVPGNKLYDAWEDPLKLYPSAEETRKLGYYTQAAQGLIHEQRIKQAGFQGYVSTPYNVAALFEPAKVTAAAPSDQPVAQGERPQALRSVGKAQTETPEFKRWFGNSKVVDENGEPLVVYHGTSAVDPFTIFNADMGRDLGSHFGTKGQADEFASWSDAFGKVYPVYLKLGNPIRLMDYGGFEESRVGFQLLKQGVLTADEEGELVGMEEHAASKYMQDKIKAAGYDGVVYLNRREAIGEDSPTTGIKYSQDDMDGMTDEEFAEIFPQASDSWIVFSPTQIKSAIGNRGTFDPTDPSILRSVNVRQQVQQARVAVFGQPSTANANNFSAPNASLLDKLIYTMVDKQIDLRDTVKAIENFAGRISEQINASLKEILYSGRVGKRVGDFLENELKPIYRALNAMNISLGDFEEYMWNRHAKEANDYVRSQGGLQDGGSGIKDADADAYMNALSPADKQRFDTVARLVDSITKTNAQLLVSYGLETQDTIDKWFAKYKSYVPLFREHIESNLGSGKGFSITGMSSKGRRGSEKKVVDILANIASQRERVITRGEKNIIAKALYGLAKANPNDDWWSIAKPRIRDTTDVDTGDPVRVPDPNYKQASNVVMHRTVVGGKVVERGVEFNTRDERARRMAEAMKNIDMDTLGTILGTTAKVTRFIAAMNTQYNPVFGITNFIRDVGTAMFNLTTTPLAGKQAEILKRTIPNLKGIFQALRGNMSSQEAKDFVKFQGRGGQTGYRDLYKTSTNRTKAIEREMRQLQAGGILKGGYAIAKLLSDYNTAMENAIRLSAFQVGIANGMSEDASASMAKGLTVNFNRKGQIATQAGAMYAFFNASVQGSARMVETLAGPMGKRIVMGGLTLGVLQAALLAAAGFGDEEPPEWVQERNIIIPTGGKTFTMIPMPLGFNIIPNIGRVSAQIALGGFKDTGKKTARMFGSVLESFNPLGSSGISLQTITPTVIDPLAALAENKDWTGKKIYREDFSNIDPTPGFSRARENTDSISKAIAWGINRISGGTNKAPGLLSPTPEEISYLAGQLTGGVGRELGKSYATAEALVQGEETPPHRIPLLNRFFGNTEGKTNDANKFYENIRTLNIHENEIQGFKTRQELNEYLADNPEARLFKMGNDMENSVSRLNKQRRTLIERDAPKESIKVIENAISVKMKQLNEQVAKLR